jgi:hypothetical protein
VKQLNIYASKPYPADTLTYTETLEAIRNRQNVINTFCINFFSFSMLDKGYNVNLFESGKYISAQELLDSKGKAYNTDKDIRRAHNISKMYLSGALNLKPIT